MVEQLIMLIRSTLCFLYCSSREIFYDAVEMCQFQGSWLSMISDHKEKKS